ncbi:MAG: LptF/LptG family permease [Myxococcota bacterium]
MKLLYRYQLKEIVVPLTVWVGFLFLLLFVMSFLRGTDVLLGSAMTAKDLGRFTLYLAPHFLQQALPIAFLLAILLGIGRLSEDGEVSAMRSLGVGPWQVLAGPLTLGSVLGAVMLGLSFTAAPWGLRSVKEAANEVIKKNLAGDVKPGVFYEDLTNLTLYAAKVNRADRGWSHVLIHDDRDPESPLLVVAQEGRVQAAGANAELTLSLADGHVHRANRQGLEYSVVDFERGDIIIGMGDSIFSKNRFRSPKEELSPKELLTAAAGAEHVGESGVPFLMAFHWRLGQVLMPLAFAVMGTPLAMSRRQSGRARGYLLTIAGYVLYYVLARVCVSLGERGKLDVLLAAQLPNVVFAALGLVALVRVTKVGTIR